MKPKDMGINEEQIPGVWCNIHSNKHGIDLSEDRSAEKHKDWKPNTFKGSIWGKWKFTKDEKEKCRSLFPDRQQVNTIFNALLLIGQSDYLAPEISPQNASRAHSEIGWGELLQFFATRTTPTPPEFSYFEASDESKDLNLLVL